MTIDRHSRTRADGHLEELDAIRELYGYDPRSMARRDAAKKYLRHKRIVAEQLRAASSGRAPPP